MIWKSKKLLVLLCLLVCSLLAGFFTSSTVHAYDITTSVSPSGSSWEWGSGTVWVQARQNGNGEANCSNTTGDAIFWGSCVNNTLNNNTWILKQVRSGNTIPFINGRYYKTILSININNQATDTFAYSQPPQLNRLIIPSGSPYKLVSITPTETTCLDDNKGLVYTNGSPSFWTTNCRKGSIQYDIIVQATSTTRTYMTLGDGSSWFLQSFIGFASGGPARGTIRPLTITEYVPENVSTVNQQQQQAGQQAQQDGQTGANSSQQQAQQGGQTLLQGFSSFVGALTSASASDCVINGDIGDFEMGNMDLCQLSPPPAFQAISSIMVIGFVVPLSIATIRKFIGMFRSFQNG